MDGDILWTPAPDAGETTKMGRFMAEVARRHGETLETYDDFQAWSVKHLEDFYGEMAQFCGVRFTDPPREVLTTRAVPDATWFPGATLNFAEHVFRALPPGTVITGVSEVRETIAWSDEDLRREVGRIPAGLLELGVRPGDVVGAYLPHIPETIAAFLATASIGAIWAVCPPEFGVNSVVDRLGQVNPKVLLAVDGYRFGGKDYARQAEVETIRAALPSVQTLVWLPYLTDGAVLADTVPAGARPWPDVFGTDGDLELHPSRSTTRSTSCSRPERRHSRRRYRTRTAARCSSTTSGSGCRPISARAIPSSGSARPAGSSGTWRSRRF